MPEKKTILIPELMKKSFYMNKLQILNENF